MKVEGKLFKKRTKIRRSEGQEKAIGMNMIKYIIHMYENVIRNM